MAETVTTGTWIVDGRNADTFVQEWTEFAAWASSQDGAGALRLGRDLGDPGRFVSFAPWAGIEEVHAWKATPEFRERMARVLQYVDEFHPVELEVVAAATAGDLKAATSSK